MKENISSKTIGTLNGLPFESIIGGPLSACIKAQAEAAVSTFNFIESVGHQQGDDGTKEAVYVAFSYVQNGRRVNVNVPLLTIVPIPYIAINNISLDFKVAITGTESAQIEDEDSITEDRETKQEQKKGGGWLTKRKTSKMTTTVSSKKDSRSTQESKFSIEATMDVQVQAGQESMPAGMAKILDLLSGAMDVVPEKGELTVDGPYPEGDNIYVIARYKNPKGLFSVNEIACDGGTASVVSDGEAKKFLFTAGTKGTKKITVTEKQTDGGSTKDVVVFTREINLSKE